MQTAQSCLFPASRPEQELKDVVTISQLYNSSKFFNLAGLKLIFAVLPVE